MDSKPVDRWTVITIVGAIVASIICSWIYIQVARKPPAWWVLFIGAVIGVAIVQVIHKKRDPWA